MPAPLISNDDAAQEFVRLAQEAAVWHTRFQSGVGDPPPGSALRGDNNWTVGYPMSEMVWHIVSAAIDNIHAFTSLTVSGGPDAYDITTRPYGAFPNLRASMENAAAAIWMLSPSARQERVSRYLRWWRQEAHYRERASEVLDGLTQETAEMRAWVDRVVAERNIPANLMSGYPKYEAMVVEAASSVGMSGAVCRLVWQTMSGMAHGERWASQVLNQMAHVADLPEPGRMAVNVTAPAGRLILEAMVAARYVRGAVDLMDHRRSVH